MMQWRDERSGWPGADATAALFLNRFGGRLSTRAVRKLLGVLARDAGLTGEDGRPPASAQTLRATFGANQLADGADALTVTRLVTVARQLGHSRLDTTLKLAASSAPGPQ
jgi:integrase/recombinase XerC